MGAGMMTDRELLEAAAMAAGVTGGVWWDDTCDGWPDPSTHWNPLADDGDALRLAVKLRLDICRPSAGHDGVCVWLDHVGDFVEVPHGADPYAATRRAIVRAAAAMAPKDEQT